jgi:hypothetical protein
MSKRNLKLDNSNKNGYVILGEHLVPYEYCWTDTHGYAKTLDEARMIAEDAILVGRTKTYCDRIWENGRRFMGPYDRARIIDLDTMDMVDDEYHRNGNGEVEKVKNVVENEEAKPVLKLTKEERRKKYEEKQQLAKERKNNLHL